MCLNGVVSDWVGCIMQLRKCSEVRSLYIEGLNNVMVDGCHPVLRGFTKDGKLPYEEKEYFR